MRFFSQRWALSISLLFLVISFALAFGAGASKLSFYDLLSLFWLKPDTQQDPMIYTILVNIRLPRLLVAALCGGALATAGVVSQGLFRNPLASPSILGTEAGASLAAVFFFFYSPSITHLFAMPMAASLGALVTTFLVLHLAHKTRGTPLEILLLTGLALSTWFSAMISLVISLSLEDYQKTTAIMHWLLGGFGGKGWEHVLMALVSTSIGWVMTYRMAPRLDVLALGEDVAHTLSVDLARVRSHAVITISILVGGAMASAGALPFVGLVVPHLCRRLFGPSHRKLALLSAINGMSLTILADLAARTVRAPQEVEVGLITALIGAPFFLWQLSRSSRKEAHGSY
jgi:iron complex transport system permease protein